MCFLHWPWIKQVIVTTLVMEGGNLLRGHCLLQEDMHVAVCTGHVKICKKKFNEIKDFEKTLQLRVKIGDDVKMVKLSLPNSASEEEVIDDEEYEDAKATLDDDEVKDLRGLEQRDQYPPLEIVKPHEKRIAREH